MPNRRALTTAGDVVGIAENAVHDPNCVRPQVLDYYAAVWQRDGTTLTLPPIAGDSDFSEQSQSTTAARSRDVRFLRVTLWRVVIERSACRALANRNRLSHRPRQPWRHRVQCRRCRSTTADKSSVVSSLPDNTTFHAFLWQSGVMTDLGTLPGDMFSVAFGINNKGQVVGQSCNASGNCRAFIWQNGAMTDLNLLVPSYSKLYLTYGGDINDSGRIVGYGYDRKSGRSPAFLALPSRSAPRP